MLDLIREGERTRRKSAAPVAADPSLDPWRFLSSRDRRAQMDNTLNTLLATPLTLTDDVVDAAQPARHPECTCALADIAGRRFLTFWYVCPVDLSKRTADFQPHWLTSHVQPRARSRLTAGSRLKFVLVYGNVTKSLLPPYWLYVRDTVAVTERFGLYLGPSQDYIVRPTGPQPGPSHARPVLEPCLYIKNVRSETLMAAAIEQCLDWVAQNSDHIAHVPFPFP
jgi:hypothetical protein